MCITFRNIIRCCIGKLCIVEGKDELEKQWLQLCDVIVRQVERI